jgi:hypothetical protein
LDPIAGCSSKAAKDKEITVSVLCFIFSPLLGGYEHFAERSRSECFLGVLGVSIKFSIGGCLVYSEYTPVRVYVL